MILVTGAGGLLGSWITKKYPKETIGFARNELNILDPFDIAITVKRVQPDVIINCAGNTPRSVEGRGYEANFIGTANLLEICDWEGIRLLHVSTDCVFSGKRGKYSENDQPDNDNDVYGYFKRLGEVTDEPGHLTIRTSFVGWPDPKGRGLLAWLHKQLPETELEGWTNVWWNGLTVSALSDYLMELAYSKAWGLMHLHGQRITKYDLLQTAAEVYGWERKINPIAVMPVDRTLKTVRHSVPYIAGTYNFREACTQMKKDGERLWGKEYQLSSR